MKLDRNIQERNGLGKYALIKLRELEYFAGHVSTFELWTPEVREAFGLFEDCHALDWGNTADSEFFVIRLKDRSAAAALNAYATDAAQYDQEWAREVFAMADRAAAHPSKKTPD